MSGPLDAYDDTRPNNTTDDAGQLPETLRNIKTKLIDHRDRIVDLETGAASITSGLAEAIATLNQLTSSVPKHKEWSFSSPLDITNSFTFPYDDTEPAISEGFEVFAEDYAAANASSHVRLGVKLSGYVPKNAYLQIALFRNTTCIGATVVALNGGGSFCETFVSNAIAVGTTDTAEYSVRCGNVSGTTITLNTGPTVYPNRLFGGAMTCTMFVEETQQTP